MRLPPRVPKVSLFLSSSFSTIAAFITIDLLVIPLSVSSQVRRDCEGSQQTITNADVRLNLDVPKLDFKKRGQ